MKKIVFIFSLLLITQLAFSQFKGSGVCYFNGFPSLIPNEAEDCEVAIDVNSSTVYKWNRTLSLWESISSASVDWTAITNIPPDIADGDQIGDDWGGQVAVSDNTLTGVATTISPLSVNESVLNIDWTQLSNIPGDIADGDDVGGAGGDDWGGQVAVSDNTLTGVATTLSPLSVNESVLNIDWTQLSNIPADIADGDDVGGAGGDDWGAQVAISDNTLTGAATAGSPLSVNESVLNIDWTQLSNIPADIADGDDVGAGGIPLALADQITVDRFRLVAPATFSNSHLQFGLYDTLTIEARKFILKDPLPTVASSSTANVIRRNPATGEAEEIQVDGSATNEFQLADGTTILGSGLVGDEFRVDLGLFNNTVTSTASIGAQFAHYSFDYYFPQGTPTDQNLWAKTNIPYTAAGVKNLFLRAYLSGLRAATQILDAGMITIDFSGASPNISGDNELDGNGGSFGSIGVARSSDNFLVFRMINANIGEDISRFMNLEISLDPTLLGGSGLSITDFVFNGGGNPF